jgi:hypothetical protein
MEELAVGLGVMEELARARPRSGCRGRDAGGHLLKTARKLENELIKHMIK